MIKYLKKILKPSAKKVISFVVDQLSVNQRRKLFLISQKLKLYTNSEYRKRASLANDHLIGYGIEIGALFQPVPLPRRAKVQYVDYLSTEKLREEYPELVYLPFQEVNIIDDGEKLNTFQIESLDFIIAMHVLEHSQDPITTLLRWINILKPGGLCFLGIPIREKSFDSKRALTSYEHLLNDYKLGPENSRMEHYLDAVHYIEGKSGEDLITRANFLADRSFSIHFHVWNGQSFRSFLDSLIKDFKLTITIEVFQESGTEILTMLKKNSID